MPDYIYLLDSRLSADQQNALRLLREAAREAETLLFLTGDAVRDLTSGHAVREMEVSVHGNALKLKKKLEKSGARVWGEDEASRSLYLCFPGTVRVDVISTHRVEYPKPGKPVIHFASIHEDLRRRDFTVNAMALSLNEASFGLLMDPLNGAADIENRTLRLVSNYGFLEDPSVLIRATRYRTRLGWELDPRSRMRYENAKGEDVIEYMPAQARSRELEQIGHEEEGLRVLQALEEEGWMKSLFSAWTHAKADEPRLHALHELAVELLMQGVHADTSAAQMRLLTAKLAPKDLNALKKLMLRPGFVEEWNNLDAMAASFAKALLAKENATPSVSFKLFMSYDPEAILWLGFTSKDKAVHERFNLFLNVWPEARQRIPHALMQELRITPDLPGYHDLVHAIFLELIDGKLETPEEMRAFLEPHSPPAPPPPTTVKRTRARRAKQPVHEEEPEQREEEEEEEGQAGEEEEEEELEAEGGEEKEEEAEAEAVEEKPSAAKPKVAPKPRPAKPEAAKPKPAAPKAAKPKTPVAKGAEKAKAPAAAKKAAKPAPVPAEHKPAHKPAHEPAHKAGAKPAAHKPKPSAAAKTAAPAKKAAPAAKHAAVKAKPKHPVKKAVAPAAKKAKAEPAKAHAKAPAKPAKKAAAKHVPAKHTPVKHAPAHHAPARHAAAKTSPTRHAHAAPVARKGKAAPAVKAAKPHAKKPAAKPAKKH